MEFGAVGIVMLTVVLIFYLRMIDARNLTRKTTSQIDSILDKADILESVAKLEAALKVINEGLDQYPGNSKLLNRKQQLTTQITEAASD